MYSSVQIKDIDFNKVRQKQPRELQKLLQGKNEEDKGYIHRMRHIF